MNTIKIHKIKLSPIKQRPVIDIIIKIFNENVKNKPIIIDKDKKHDGCEGHWLENKMGCKHNNKNKPDLYGYELKKYSNTITLGDFSASKYLYTDNVITRTQFFTIFWNAKSIKKQ